jgi:hypothetical protein
MVSRCDSQLGMGNVRLKTYEVGTECTVISPLLETLSSRRQRCHGKSTHVSFGKGRSDLGN